MNLDKIINLVKKTNDKIIIVDENNNTNLVLMPFSDYEKIIENADNIKNLNEKEMLNQIDRDISIWKQEHPEQEDELEIEDPFKSEFDKPELDYRPWEDEDEKKDFKNNNWEEDDYENENEDEEEEEDFTAPKYDLDADEIKNNDLKFDNLKDNSETEPIKYEDIPPPPDVTASDFFRTEEKPIIDVSFDEKDIDENNDEEIENEFEEEAVY